jgi:hypothetical protein
MRDREADRHWELREEARYRRERLELYKALLLFTASSEDIVRRIGRLSELPFDRIVDSIHIGFDQEPSGKTAGM